MGNAAEEGTDFADTSGASKKTSRKGSQVLFDYNAEPWQGNSAFHFGEGRHVA